MSVVGINIKKIRGVKGLNQTDFANLFGLTRANIGSYEELRAEPKIDTIIKIATYYKLPIDKLVRKELTVNDISNFDVFSKLPLPIGVGNKNEVIFVGKSNLDSYPKNKSNKSYISELDKVLFPFGNENSQKIILYNEGNDLCFNHEGLLHGDLLFLEKITKIKEQVLGVVVDDNAIYKGLLTDVEGKICINPLNPNVSKVQLNTSKKVVAWKIVGRYTSEVITGFVLG